MLRVWLFENEDRNDFSLLCATLRPPLGDAPDCGTASYASYVDRNDSEMAPLETEFRSVTRRAKLSIEFVNRPSTSDAAGA